ncbi:MAG: hypothetical protein H7066_05415 [Cytophagaceae bacterium]|nr:hypothetical protein [Gemmatimonadaceae bacterium]
MPLSRLSSRRLGLVGLVAATGFVASCDTTVGFSPNELLWGFVTVAAQKNGVGATRTSPTAVFFRGEVSSLPSATVKPDSCFPAQNYVPPTNTFTGVTYLDAGTNVSLTLGGVANDLPRVSASGVTTYKLATGTTLPYQPGDSIVVRVPGANGGYPTTEVRAKTAEAFTLQPVTPPTSGFMHLRWTPATDGNSAILFSLQYAPAGGTGAISREITCAFVDDGADSISATEYEAWAASTNLKREVVANRLRTVLQNISGGGFQFISTYTVPTPTP